ncbi:BolA family protein [Luteimonas huabeiensis]|uniref:BolA family protein n=1 Tax=Luteimonas huabeiensis TaxID=1244513 RepID=UPI0006948AA4|nr:BolA family protein [Luteimonas huabeiensis]
MSDPAPHPDALPREARVAAIRQALEAAFSPRQLEIRDDSHRHAGHAGARDGRGHFHVRIVADAFAGMGTLQRHRAIYAALGRLMETDIHALSIQADAPD